MIHAYHQTRQVPRRIPFSFWDFRQFHRLGVDTGDFPCLLSTEQLGRNAAEVGSNKYPNLKVAYHLRTQQGGLGFRMYVPDAEQILLS